MIRFSKPAIVLTVIVGICGNTHALADLVIKDLPFPAEDLSEFLLFDSELDSSAETDISVAVRLLEAKEYDEAISLIKAFLDSYPGFAPAHEILGTALLFNGETEAGLRSFEEALRLAPHQTGLSIKIGDVLYIREEYDKAKSRYEMVIESNPEDSRAHRRLGLVFDTQGKYELAASHYEKGLTAAMQPYLQTRVRLGRLYNLFGRYQEALEVVEGYIDADSSDADAHFVLGNAYLSLNNIVKGVGEFEIAARLDPESPKMHLALGIVYRIKGDYEQSLSELNMVIKAEAGLAEGHYQTAETLLQMNRFDDAIRSFEKAALSSSNPVFVQHRIAELHIIKNQTSEAISVYQDLIASDQAVLRTYELLGSVYQRAGQLDNAERTFEKATTIYSDNPHAFYVRGYFYGSLRNFDQAIIQFENVLRLSPDDVTALRALSSAFQQKGDKDKSIEMARKILNIQPDNVNNKFYLASLYQGAGDDEIAIDLYEEIISEIPDHPLALNNLATLLASSGEHEKALANVRKAAALLPDNGVVLDTLGWILFEQGKMDGAIVKLSRAVTLSSDNPTIHYHLGMAYYRNNERTNALGQFEKALSLTVEFPERVDAMARKEELLSQAVL